MFIHDSLHTARNTLFEMERVAKVMAAGGIMLIDDISSHDGFSSFARRHPEYRTIVAPSDDRIGLFGIAVHQAG
jgi:cephalosporin hydroxylase